MEDVQFADPIPARGDEPMTSVEEQPSTSELPVTVDPAVRQTEGGPFVDAIPPKNIVEVVIEKKAKVELEEPILPDHYYDGGNIPVFKPVSIRFLASIADISRQWTNFAILKSLLPASIITV